MKKDKRTAFLLLSLCILAGVGVAYYWSEIGTFFQQLGGGKDAIKETTDSLYRRSQDECKEMIEEGNRLLKEGKSWLLQHERSLKRVAMYEEGKKKDADGLFHKQDDFVKKLRKQAEEYRKKGETLVKKGEALLNEAAEEKKGRKDDTGRD